MDPAHGGADKGPGPLQLLEDTRAVGWVLGDTATGGRGDDLDNEIVLERVEHRGLHAVVQCQSTHPKSPRVRVTQPRSEIGSRERRRSVGLRL